MQCAAAWCALPPRKVGEMAMLAQRALMRAPATSLRSAAPIHRSQSRTFIYVSGTPPLKL